MTDIIPIDRAKESRFIQVSSYNCFVCGAKIEDELKVQSGLCLYHFIRRHLRKRGIFFWKSTYKNPNSRVKRERQIKRGRIVGALRARYIAVAHKELEPFQNFREAIFWIDSLYDTLALNHAFVMRKLRIGAFLHLLFHLDYLALNGWKRKGWVGPLSNMSFNQRKGASEKE